MQNSQKNGHYIKIYGYIYSNTEWNEINLCKVKRPRRKVQKKHDKPYMPKKAIKSGTQGRKFKVLKRHIDLTARQQQSANLAQKPVDKSLPTFELSWLLAELISEKRKDSQVWPTTTLQFPGLLLHLVSIVISSLYFDLSNLR